MTHEERNDTSSEASILSKAKSRVSGLMVSRSEIDEQLARINTRIDDEIRGLEQRASLSLRDEVTRLDDLIRALYLRIDTFMAEVGRVDALAAALEERLSEVVELRGQDRSAERLDARRFTALEQRLAALESSPPPRP